MNQQLLNQTCALAGIFQVAALVEKEATTGSVPNDSLKSSLYSLYQRDASDVAAVYDGIAGLNLGLHTLQKVLARDQQTLTANIFRYGFSLVHLQAQLAKRHDMLGEIADQLDQQQRQLKHFAPNDDVMVEALAQTYQETLSTLPFRIQVKGDMRYLKTPICAARIRALLLAGVRSATLWQQLGGRRWRLILQRHKIANCVQHLLQG